MEEKRMQAQELMQNQVAPLYNEIYDTMRELMNENVREGDSLSSILNIMGFIFLLIIVGVIVLAIIIATRMEHAISQGIAAPLMHWQSVWRLLHRVTCPIRSRH